MFKYVLRSRKNRAAAATKTPRRHVATNNEKWKVNI